MPNLINTIFNRTASGMLGTYLAIHQFSHGNDVVGAVITGITLGNYIISVKESRELQRNNELEQLKVTFD